MVDTYRSTKLWGNYPLLAIDTEVNNCSIHKKREIILHKKDDFHSLIPMMIIIYSGAIAQR